MEDSFDYKILAYCKYGVYGGEGNEVIACDAPATHKIWWKADMSDAIHVCSKHFGLIYNAEKKEVR